METIENMFCEEYKKQKENIVSLEKRIDDLKKEKEELLEVLAIIKEEAVFRTNDERKYISFGYVWNTEKAIRVAKVLGIEEKKDNE